MASIVDDLVRVMDWSPRFLRVPGHERVVVRRDGITLPRVLSPGRHGPFFGLPLTGSLEYVVFNVDPVWHSVLLTGVRLADGELVDLEVKALVRLAWSFDEELIDWASERDHGALAHGVILSEELDWSIRRFCGGLRYGQLRHQGFELADMLTARARSTVEGLLEIIRFRQATAHANPLAETRFMTRRPVLDGDVQQRADELAALAMTLRDDGGLFDPLHALRSIGWIDHADFELERLAELVREQEIEQTANGALACAAVATILLMLDARSGEERWQALQSLFAWRWLRENRRAQWALLAERHHEGDFTALAAMLRTIAPDPPGSPVSISPTTLWQTPASFVLTPEVRSLLHSMRLAEAVTGACSAPSTRPGERALYLVSPVHDRLSDSLSTWNRALNEVTDTDRLVILPHPEDPDVTLAAWFGTLVGCRPQHVQATVRGGTLALVLSADLGREPVSAWSLHAYAEAVTALTGMRYVSLGLAAA